MDALIFADKKPFKPPRARHHRRQGGIHAFAEIHTGRVGHNFGRRLSRQCRAGENPTVLGRPARQLGSIILEKKDLAKHLGKSYMLEPVRYQGTPPMITAIANGELEIADFAYSTPADRHSECRAGRSARDLG